MRKEIILFITWFVFTLVFISAQISEEECIQNEECGQNEICINYKCMSAGTIPDKTNIEQRIIGENNQSLWIIIAISIIVGFIILVIILKNKR